MPEKESKRIQVQHNGYVKRNNTPIGDSRHPDLDVIQGCTMFAATIHREYIVVKITSGTLRGKKRGVPTKYLTEEYFEKK